MACILDGGRLTLTGDVGDYWGGESFTYADVVLALAQIDAAAELTVHLNSGGGIATEGAAIHSLLASRSGVTNVVVEGVAASAASLIAMAGDTVTMMIGSVQMIHDPALFTLGTSADHARSIEMLEAMATSYARVYAQKSGKTVDEARAVMKAERWLTPEDAVAEGFADVVGGEKAAMVAAFDYRKYERAPQRLVALAKKKNWTLSQSGPRPTASASPRQIKETDPMPTDKERADAAEAELATLKASATAEAGELATLRKEKADRERCDAIMALDEANGREAQAKALADAGVAVDAAKAVLAAAPKLEATVDDAEAYERARMSGAGLGRGDQKPDAAAVKAGWAKAFAR